MFCSRSTTRKGRSGSCSGLGMVMVMVELKPGNRIRLIEMDGEPDMEPGALGTVESIVPPPVNVVHVRWDNGRTLNICPEVDRFEKIG